MSSGPSLTRRMIRVLPLALMLLATGCGFQLRGSSPVPPALQPLAVVCDRQVPEPLCQAVREQLELGRVQVQDATEAAYILTLDDFRQDRRATAITARGSAAEYRLSQSLRMSVRTADQVPLLAGAELVARESYRYDETNVLAKQREQEDLERQLHDRLAQQVLFRLAPLTEARIRDLRQAHEAP